MNNLVKSLPRRNRDILRFWSKTQRRPDGCLEWQGRIQHGGYGMFGKTRAHRFAWSSAFGAVPADLVVMHSCDNRRCVALDHLFVSTQGDNLRDMWSKGRARPGTVRVRGEEQGHSKLTEMQVREIRQFRAEGMRQRDIATVFGVHVMTISDILRGVTWRHVQ